MNFDLCLEASITIQMVKNNVTITSGILYHVINPFEYSFELELQGNAQTNFLVLAIQAPK